MAISIGISAIAELQLDGGLFNRLAIKDREPAPLSYLLTVTGDSTSDIQDLMIGTKVRLMSERTGAAGAGVPVHDEAAKREQRERARHGHD